MNKLLLIFALILSSLFVYAQEHEHKKDDTDEKPAVEGHYNINKFKQLHEELATPNAYRTASGAPGYAYYQQKADYQINVTLDDKNQKIYGEATITYHNKSPDPLDYLWVQ